MRTPREEESPVLRRSYYPPNYFDDEFRAQTVDTKEALLQARECFAVARLIKESGGRGTRFILRAFAYLNRACELACVPLDLYLVETAQGAEMAWHTYRPIADFESGRSFHLPVVVGYENSMSGTEARSRAIGW